MDGIGEHSSDIEEFQEGKFLVKSQTQKHVIYLVEFNGNSTGLPSFNCNYWKRMHLPCKHLMAVFRQKKWM